eukprot:CAMPEP_0119012866 /NCGR_PEP_ID=MMETSP1176-20130426/7668_1 /TAXON_ID=265551 /ORGANISM="Synedropsis recta cf, Strain CCMP1620" /LENGTH=223 /DNA_ID=CAMNT_0006965901 /DNA_START=222 /DNA_END=893 /DNA_ORIENTATION=-
MAAFGTIITIGAAGLNFAFYTGGFIYGWALVFLLLGIMLVLMSIFAEFKGNIELYPYDNNSAAITNRRVCPACTTQGQMERYNFKTGTTTERSYRVIYTRVKTTTHWAPMIHCRSCGYKGNTDIYGAPVRAGNGAGAGRGANNNNNGGGENDPLAKARAILEAAKKKRLPVVVGKIVYAKVALDDDSTDIPTTTECESATILTAHGVSCTVDDDDDDPLRMIV